MSSLPKDVFEYIKQEETRFDQPIEVMDNWNWGMKEHIRMSILMKHGKFIKATNEYETKNPKKNIVYPLLNLRYRAEDIDLKEGHIYADDDSFYHLSFLVKKYHDEVYVRTHDLDTLFDELKEEKIDLGGTLVRKGPKGWIHENLDTLAFCDQTSLLSGPLCFKEFFAPDELLEQEKIGWGSTANGADITLDELITLAEEAKRIDTNKSKKTTTPGRYIEVYRLHGSLPSEWLQNDPKKPSNERFVRQMQIVAFYDNADGLKTGVTLYKKKEYDNPFKVHLSGRKLRNRALSFGGVEELFDPQIWTDYSEIIKKDMLTAASKVILYTNDETYANKNKVRDMDNLQVTTVRDGAEIKQVPTASGNIQLFNEAVNEWNSHAQTTSGSTPALMGVSSPGTAAKLQALITQQSQGLHDYRKGKFATFVQELYEADNGILADIAAELSNGAKFLATLSSDEMEYVTECMVTCQLNQFKIEHILNTPVNQFIDPTVFDAYEQQLRAEFAKGGNKKFIEILKGELKDINLKVKFDIGGKQKDMQQMAETMTKVIQLVFSTYNPQTGKFAALEDPKALKAFNKLFEYSGLDPIDFGYVAQQPQYQQPQGQPQLPQQQAPQQPPQQQAPQPSPIQPQVALPQHA